MAGNSNLAAAAKAKNDEFYTQYSDIEAEMNAYVAYNPDVFRDKTILCPCDDPDWSNFTRYFATNFQRFGLKKLICTSYAKSAGTHYQTSLLEENSPLYRPDKHATNGKLYTLTHDVNGNGKADLDDIEFKGYLKGDGDFRSDEVTKLRDEVDIIITNPPFSLFREFLSWVIGGGKQFVILGNMNAITYKEVFPLLKSNKIWTGTKKFGGGMDMIQPKNIFDATKTKSYKVDKDGNIIKNIMGVIWFTDLDHGKRHEKLSLMTMAENLQFNDKLRKKLINFFGQDPSNLHYPKYDNYDAIEVPFVEAIPSDYNGVMGVPITFLDKYNPEQFEIIGCSYDYGRPKGWSPNINMSTTIKGISTYKRLFIQRRRNENHA